MSRREDQELILRCTQVANFTQKAAEDGDLIEALRGVGSRLRTYAFKSRYKGANNILKKVIRKRKDGVRLLSRLSVEKSNLPPVKARTEDQRNRAKKIPKEQEAAQELIDYEPDHVTDAWGCRFVTLYQSEIPLTVSALLAELHAFNQGGHGAAVRLKEFVI